MFIVTLHCLRPLDEVDVHSEAHRAHLAEHHASGTFLLSGPKAPRTGGVILARAACLEDLHRVLARDPLHVHDIASFEVVQFSARAVAPGLEPLRET